MKKIFTTLLISFAFLPIITNAQTDLGIQLLEKARNEETLIINSVVPNDEEWGPDAYIANFIRKNIKSTNEYDNYNIYAYPCTNINNCELHIDELFGDTTENYNIKIEYDDSEIVQKTVNDVETIAEKILNHPTKKFSLSDLAMIDYYYHMSNYDLNKSFITSNMINYSSNFRELVGNTNLDFFIDFRLGELGLHKQYNGGYLGIYHNGNLYKVLTNDIYVVPENIIYIDESVEDTTEAYMRAAEERVNGFFKKEIINIEQAKDLKTEYFAYVRNNFNENATDEELTQEYQERLEDPGSYGEYNMLEYSYDVKINGKVYSFIIVKEDLSTIEVPKNLNTIDYTSNLMIKSDVNGLPLDTKVSVENYGKEHNRFKLLAKKYDDIDMYTIYDIELYSQNADKKIEKLDNGMFKVYVPMKEEYKGKTIEAYYINDKGEKEIHEIKEENGYLVFETNHFSEYILGEKKSNNPKTSDNINIVYTMLMFYSILFFLSVKYLKK